VTSSLDTEAANAGRSPEASSTASISDLGAELATASRQRPDSARTASTAPGSSGR
jgi:hypothetical protein